MGYPRLSKGPPKPKPPRIRSLSPRDKLWLWELSHGTPYKQLTGATTVSAAKMQVQRIRKWFGVHTTVHVVAEALRKGIIK